MAKMIACEAGAEGGHPRELYLIFILKYQMCSVRVEELKIGSTPYNPLPPILIINSQTACISLPSCIKRYIKDSI